jgi:hypothetical protein
MRKATATFSLLLVALLIFWGCEGPEGVQGPQGDPGDPGVNPPLAPIITALLAIPDSIGTNQSTQFVVAAYDPNGDTLSYHWMADVGSFNDATVANPTWTATDEMGLFTFTVHVIAGGDTTTGTLIVGVNTYVPSVMPYYLGDNPNTCGHCHESVIGTWMGTKHSFAHDSLVSDPSYNEFCYPCHNTGWDETLDNGGYDDNPVAALNNVQCEACHGPKGPNPAVNNPNVGLPDLLAGTTCAAQCHTVQPAEWATSMHGTAMERAGGEAAFVDEWDGSSCNYCHIAEGFLGKWDPDWPSTPDFEEYGGHQIGCGICHDAHDMHTSTQLRAQEDIALVYPTGYEISGWNESLMCGNCHRGRRSETTIENHLNNGDDHFGEHPSAEGDMVEGIGSYEIPGYEVAQTPNQHSNFASPCTDCHMRYVEGEFGPEATGHTFEPELITCQTGVGCHPFATDFNILGRQDSILALMDDLQSMILNDNPELQAATWIDSTVGDTSITTPEQRAAAWAWFFVESDGTFGIHNKYYAAAILQASIDYYGTVAASKRDDNLWGEK